MRNSAESTKARLHELVDTLTPERLEVAAALLERLASGTQTVWLGGLWKNLRIEITEGDIAEVRRKLWGRMGKGHRWLST